MKVQDVLDTLETINEQRAAIVRAEDEDALPEYVYSEDILNIFEDYERILRDMTVTMK